MLSAPSFVAPQAVGEGDLNQLITLLLQSNINSPNGNDNNFNSNNANNFDNINSNNANNFNSINNKFDSNNANNFDTINANNFNSNNADNLTPLLSSNQQINDNISQLIPLLTLLNSNNPAVPSGLANPSVLPQPEFALANQDISDLTIEDALFGFDYQLIFSEFKWMITYQMPSKVFYFYYK